jgi:hypothetical protein
MKSLNALTQTRPLTRKRELWVEHLEDRLVPGETLASLLLLPLTLLPSQEPTSEPVAVSEGPSAFAVTESSRAADFQNGLFADSGEGRSMALDRLGTDTPSATVASRNAAPAGSASEMLVPQTALAGDLAGGGMQLPSLFASGPAPKELANGAVDMSVATPRADLPAPVPISSAGSIQMPGAAPSPVASNVGPAGDAAAAPAVAVPQLLFGPQGKPSSTPSGYSPAQIRHAYGFDQLPAKTNGSGVTIGIIDFFDDPNITSDLNTFSVKFGLPTTISGAFTFTKAFFPQGSQPAPNGDTAIETSLDVEWAHAIAPHANILLVETADTSTASVFGAVDYAVAHGAEVVSMSFGYPELELGSSELALDSHFNVPGVAFVASAGDAPNQVIYPSSSPYVVSVGGTTLPLDSKGNLTGPESAWSDGGGGPSFFESEPGYQTSYGITITAGHRGTPDVSYVADPNTGVTIYDSFPFYALPGLPGFASVGGTSAGAPQWSGLIALADQGRATPLSSSSLTSSPLYNAATGSTNYASNYRDITKGTNGYAATPGYDLATGLGSPHANSLVPYLNSH